MRVRHALVIASLIVPASARIATAEDRATLFSQKPAKDPYAKLFTGATAAAQQLQQPRVPTREVGRTDRPKVVCGMVMIPADASVDPRFRLSPPPNDNVKGTIRAIKPPMCHPDEPQ